MKFELRQRDGEIILCDSCDSQAPTAEFDWDIGTELDKDRPPKRLLCEFCCTTMASRHTAHYPQLDEYSAMRAEVWKAAAAVFNMLSNHRVNAAAQKAPSQRDSTSE